MADRKHFKTEAAFDGLAKMHPKAQEVLKYAIDQALILGVKEPMITETFTTVEHDKALGRVSSSHSQGRAFDFRTWNLNESQLKTLNGLLTAKYGKIGAINKLGTRQLVVFHDIGLGPHFHVQLDGRFKVEV